MKYTLTLDHDPFAAFTEFLLTAPEGVAVEKAGRVSEVVGGPPEQNVYIRFSRSVSLAELLNAKPA